MSKTLELSIGTECIAPRALLTMPSEEYIAALERNGYDRIRLTKLDTLSMKRLDGKPGHEYTVWVDPDAQFIISYYAKLEKIINEQRSQLHGVYLDDGCLEFSAYVAPDSTILRVGVFRDSPFEPPFADGIRLSTESYLGVWRFIADRIVTATLEA